MGETEVEELSLVEKKIIRQIEYYFGDVNLPRDKFMKEKQEEDEGWITLECLTTFNRLKELSTDLKQICTTLQKSKSGLLEIDSDALKIRRSKDKPLPDLDDPLYQKKKKMKTLYMKGFPTTYTFDNVSDFLLDQNINTVFIKLRKDEEFNFKGSVFVELSTQAEADKLLENKELKCEDEPLIIMKREDYFQKKSTEKRGGGGGGGGNQPVKTEGPKLEKKTGAIMHLKGLSEQTRREDLKALFGPIAAIAWVDFNMKETQGFIRFEEDGAAQKTIDGVKEKNDGKVIVKGLEVEVRVLEGEEEDNYWKMAEEEMQKRKSNKFSGGGRGGRRGGKGGRSEGKNFKRKRPWESGPKEKDDSTDNTPQGEHVRFSDNENKESSNDVPTDAKKAKADVEE